LLSIRSLERSTSLQGLLVRLGELHANIENYLKGLHTNVAASLRTVSRYHKTTMNDMCIVDFTFFLNKKLEGFKKIETPGLGYCIVIQVGILTFRLVGDERQENGASFSNTDGNQQATKQWG
jgi:hypothetical protein